MKPSASFLLDVPAASPEAGARRKVEPVGGAFAVTAQLPTLGDILDWQEGTCAFDYGYYRFIDHPALRQVQEGLQAHYGVRHSLAYCSLPAAVLELLDYLLLARPAMTLKVVSEAGASAAFSLEEALPGLQAPTRATTPDRLGDLGPWSDARAEVLVIAVREPGAFLETHAAWLHGAKAQRVPIVVVSDRIPEKGWMRGPVLFGVMPLHEDRAPVTGGAILSNADRPMAELRSRRKLRGPILSSRNAACFLGRLPLPWAPCADAVIHRICALEQARFGFLFPSGMQAIMTLLALLRRPGKAQVITVGHLYTDTYSLLSYARHRVGPVENIFLGVDELDRLPALLTEQTAALLTETITNPLNDVPDLAFIVGEARKHGLPVIVDNTFATPVHCNPLAWGADFVVHSSTKYFSGRNDHAGGIVLLNDTDAAEAIRVHQDRWGTALSPLESAVLWDRLQDLEQRMHRFQANADRLAAFLDGHAAVDRVYYSGLPSHRSHAVARRLLRGYGSVVSFTLKASGLEGLRRFYDAPLAPILKAPSLGSNQTMVCPYTLLAHYHEPDEVLEDWGLPRYLIRLAVGCEEDIHPVLAALDRAL